MKLNTIGRKAGGIVREKYQEVSRLGSRQIGKYLFKAAGHKVSAYLSVRREVLMSIVFIEIFNETSI